MPIGHPVGGPRGRPACTGREHTNAPGSTRGGLGPGPGTFAAPRDQARARTPRRQLAGGTTTLVALCPREPARLAGRAARRGLLALDGQAASLADAERRHRRGGARGPLPGQCLAPLHFESRRAEFRRRGRAELLVSVLTSLTPLSDCRQLSFGRRDQRRETLVALDQAPRGPGRVIRASRGSHSGSRPGSRSRRRASSRSSPRTARPRGGGTRVRGDKRGTTRPLA